MAVWPASVPTKALVASYSSRAESNIAEFSVEAGPPKRRRRTSVTTALVSFEQILTDAEFTALMVWWRDVLKDGAISFTRPHPKTGLAATFHFVSPPTDTWFGDGLVKTSLQLRQLP